MGETLDGLQSRTISVRIASLAAPQSKKES
jgi:hypothetical protein